MSLETERVQREKPFVQPDYLEDPVFLKGAIVEMKIRVQLTDPTNLTREVQLYNEGVALNFFDLDMIDARLIEHARSANKQYPAAHDVNSDFDSTILSRYAFNVMRFEPNSGDKFDIIGARTARARELNTQLSQRFDLREEDLKFYGDYLREIETVNRLGLAYFEGRLKKQTEVD